MGKLTEAKRLELKKRLKAVMITKIKRLTEAPERYQGEEDEDEEYGAAMGDAPPVPAAPAPTDAPAEPRREPQDVAAPAPAAPEQDVAAPEQAPTAPERDVAIPGMDDAPVDGMDEPAPEPEMDPAPEAKPGEVDGDSAIRGAKVKLFFDRLEASPTLMTYLNFATPMEQGQAIERFAQMVGVPSSELPHMMKNLRQMSQKRESRHRKKKVLETKFVAFYNGKKIEIDGTSLYDAKKKAIEQLKIPRSKQGLLSVVNADEHDKGNSYKYN
tara:strand:- start:3746 stop:4555 length:810 start_codon:yes stop_codon:yes gene_type:complete